MSVFIRRDSGVIVQGITGREGSYHTREMLAYGTNIVAGVTPGKGGEWAEGKPIFDTVKAAVDATGANVSVIFVPAEYADDAIYEALDSNMELIICITEGIPLVEMMKIKTYIARHTSRFIGPNSPGILVPEQIKVGTIPGESAYPGHVGVLSCSGTLTYEVIASLTRAGIGQSTCVGIGSDPIIGMTLIEALELFESDPHTEKIVLVGEAGGYAEIEAANFVKSYMTKPVVAYIVGYFLQDVAKAQQSGLQFHEDQPTVATKIEALKAAGVRVAHRLDHIPELLG